eukprot:jgi/Tetstr1/441380/TSEL_029629.t1
MKKFFSRKSKRASAGEAGDLTVDTPAGSVTGSLTGSAQSMPGLGKKASSFSLGGSSHSVKAPGSGDGKKGMKSILGGKKKGGKGAQEAGGQGELSRSEVAQLRNELREKEERLQQLERLCDDTNLKAQEWKEYSNMQRFKVEVLVDMWVLRMVNGDGELETLPVDLQQAI